MSDDNLDDITLDLVTGIQKEAIQGLKVRFRNVILPKMIRDAAHAGQSYLHLKTQDVPSVLPHSYINEVLAELEERGFIVREETELWKWWFISWSRREA